ncbi:Oxalate:formate antiporter [Dirofilaria immitis]|nr:Oxalate:formate antiporter [Dirofilaria immitis]
MFSFAMIIGGFMNAKLGLRLATSLGCAIMTTGVFLTYWTIKRSFLTFLVTYGIMFGFGQGIAYVLTWAPKHVGFVSGIVAAGFGISSSIFAPLQTIYLNPLNHRPTVFAYFTDNDIIARVPSIFHTFAAVYGIMQAIGLIFICDPVDVNKQSEALQMQISTSVWKWFDEVFESKHISLYRDTKQYAYSRLRTFSQESESLKEEMVNLSEDYTSLNPLQMLQSIRETFIDDDKFIAYAFSVASICNALARVGWGILADRTSFQVSLSYATFLATMLLLTMPLTPIGGKWIYSIWMNLMFICLAATHALFITASVKCFGSNHKSTNYGFLILSTTLSAVLLAVGCEYVLTVVGYTFAFLITAILAFIGTHFFWQLQCDVPQGAISLPDYSKNVMLERFLISLILYASCRY